MRYFYFCLLLLPFTLFAQTPIPSDLRTPEFHVEREAVAEAPTTPTAIVSATHSSNGWLGRKTQEQKILFDKKFYALMMGLQASTVLDMESSYYTLKNCPRGYVCQESNPMLRPFVHSGRPTAYAFTTGTNVLAVWSSYYMRKKGSRFWWAPMTLYIGVHTFAAAKNFHTTTK